MNRLPGWPDDDLAGALEAYLLTARPGWPVPQAEGAREFFASSFVAQESQEGLLTGYYEPELPGADHPAAPFLYPLYGSPSGWTPGAPWHSRAEIDDGDLLRGREIAWLDNPLDAFLAQVQGSIRVRLPDGRVLRLGYAGKNGHPYISIGAELVRRGAVAAGRISVQAIREWCSAHSGEVRGLLRCNPSFVFFRILDLPDASGPLGAMGMPVTALRSIAADPEHVPPGAPVWVDSFGPERFARLMIAQDTGSAIRGPGRADVFCGSGAEAGERAGRMKEKCRLTVLLPKGAT